MSDEEFEIKFRPDVCPVCRKGSMVALDGEADIQTSGDIAFAEDLHPEWGYPTNYKLYFCNCCGSVRAIKNEEMRAWKAR